MGLNYEPVKLEHLGRGGTAEDVALVDEVEEKLAHLRVYAGRPEATRRVLPLYPYPGRDEPGAL